MARLIDLAVSRFHHRLNMIVPVTMRRSRWSCQGSVAELDPCEGVATRLFRVIFPVILAVKCESRCRISYGGSVG